MKNKRYAKIVVVGHDAVYADENEKKENGSHPDFRGDGVAVWINDRQDDRR